MIKITIYLLLLNFIADQILQPKIIRAYKNKSTLLMLGHVVSWAIVMWALSMILCHKLQNWDMLFWFFTISILHFLIDWPLGRWQSSLMDKGNVKTAAKIIYLEYTLVTIMLLFTFNYFILGFKS